MELNRDTKNSELPLTSALDVFYSVEANYEDREKYLEAIEKNPKLSELHQNLQKLSSMAHKIGPDSISKMTAPLSFFTPLSHLAFGYHNGVHITSFGKAYFIFIDPKAIELKGIFTVGDDMLELREILKRNSLYLVTYDFSLQISFLKQGSTLKAMEKAIVLHKSCNSKLADITLSTQM